MSAIQCMSSSKRHLILLPHSICVRVVLQVQVANAGYAAINISDFRVCRVCIRLDLPVKATSAVICERNGRNKLSRIITR